MIPFFPSVYTPLSVEDVCCHQFRKERSKIIPEILKLKRQRHVQLGSDLGVTFEHKVLVWFQIQEMLWAENRTDGIEEEILIYNPLIPQSNVITITAMWEYLDPKVRHDQLKKLWNFVSYLYVCINNEKYFASLLPEDTWIPEGEKALSVNFLRFVIPKNSPFPDHIRIDHPCYSAYACIPESVRGQDFV
ncbi:hypothetical protein P618_201017 [Holospora obtusa F1]|uniref:Uncharacterized protein n=1 Tax=Holospora obtusa F1 TaxID=1399147 RepID=W6TD47_HOLOB|nr:DUF3501 family protein [Holospora obtusa]ETZ06828.1 hypothetical protein P618_201017 [Holospora obtusa F1]